MEAEKKRLLRNVQRYFKGQDPFRTKTLWWELTDILRGRDNEAAGQQQDRSKDVVQPEDGIVCLDVLVLEVILQAAQ